MPGSTPRTCTDGTVVPAGRLVEVVVLSVVGAAVGVLLEHAVAVTPPKRITAANPKALATGTTIAVNGGEIPGDSKPCTAIVGANGGTAECGYGLLTCGVRGERAIGIEQSRVLSLRSPLRRLCDLRIGEKFQLNPFYTEPLVFAAAPCLPLSVARNEYKSACCTLLHGEVGHPQPCQLKRSTTAHYEGCQDNSNLSQQVPANPPTSWSRCHQPFRLRFPGTDRDPVQRIVGIRLG